MAEKYHPQKGTQKMKNLKIVLLVLVMVSLSSVNSPYAKSKAPKQKLYTAYNIWRVPQSKMKCINFKYGSDIIRAGTEVSNVKLTTRGNRKAIRFKTVKEGKTIIISYNPVWHPKRKIEDYKKMMFTTKTFSELTKGMTANEIRAIKAGVLVQGMSKREVLVAYGPPPEHYTPDLDSNRWRYWTFLDATKTVFFNRDDTLIGGADVIFDSCDIKDKLLKLQNLLKEGLITQEEHDKKKEDLLRKF